MDDQQRDDMNLTDKESRRESLVALSSSSAQFIGFLCLVRARWRDGRPAISITLFVCCPRRNGGPCAALYAFMRVADDLTDGPEAVADKRWPWRVGGSNSMPRWPAFILTPCIRPSITRSSITAFPAAIWKTCSTASAWIWTRIAMTPSPTCIATVIAWRRRWAWRASTSGDSRDERALTYAESAGIALQLTNILRDLGEDAARGRVYLPREDLERFGYRVEDLEHGRRDERFRATDALPGRTRPILLRSGEPLADLLAPAGRAVFLVMLRTYRGLLETIEKRDYDVFSRRVGLSRLRKLWLAAQVLPLRWGWR